MTKTAAGFIYCKKRNKTHYVNVAAEWIVWLWQSELGFLEYYHGVSVPQKTGS